MRRGRDYFDFAECLSDLVRTEHLTLSADGLYAITDKGLRNSRICESSLPYSVRLRCDKNLAACNRHLRRKSQVKASTEKRPNGTYTVRLELSDDMGSVMDLRLAIPREDMAAMLTERFQKSPERLYGEIMRTLMSSEPEDEAPQEGRGAPSRPPGLAPMACRPVLGDKEGFSCFRLYGTGCSSRSSPFWPVCCSAGCCAAGGAAGC